MYYPSSENKGADQLRGYREADLRLCFRLCRLLVFPWGGSYNVDNNKGGDHYREADLRLCFRLCRLLVFPWGGSYNVDNNKGGDQTVYICRPIINFEVNFI